MEEHNSLEKQQKRIEQIDPIIMYLIVRESLNMSAGKACAQSAHASQMLLLQHQANIALLNENKAGDNFEKILSMTNIFRDWLNSSFRKVVLRADDKEWLKLKEEFKDSMVLVIDSGLTEVPSGSETVIGLMPMYKSHAPKLIKKLQVLK